MIPQPSHENESSAASSGNEGRFQPLAGRLLRWPAYPVALQAPLLAFTVLVTLLALRTPRHSEMNVGAALVWQLWWAFLPIVTLVAARTWCAVCPFALLGDLAQRLRSAPPPLPSARLHRIAPWLGTAALAALGFLFLLLSLESNGGLTALLLGVFALAVVAVGLLWRGHVWCRHLCPVGLLLGLYSRLALLRLEPLGQPGRKAAALGARRCPQFTSLLAPHRAQDCTLCAACLRVPGSESVAVQLKAPDPAGQTLRPAEAAAVSMLMGLMLVDGLRMTPLFSRYMARAVPALEGRYELAMALGMLGVVALLVLAQVGLALLGSEEAGFSSRFGRLSLALLPLVLATQLALSAQHLMALGEVLRNLAAELELVAPGHMPPADAYTLVWPMKVLQGLTLGAGAVASLRVARHPDGRGWHLWPAMPVLAALPLLIIFGGPMSVTC